MDVTARHRAAADADAETTLFGSSCFSAAAAVGDITAAAMAVEMDADVTTAVSGSSCSSAAAAAGAMETDAALAADLLQSHLFHGAGDLPALLLRFAQYFLTAP